MQLDIFNKTLGVIPPAEVFHSCPRCKSGDLFVFEGEVFCQRCAWDSVSVHAEVLADAQLRSQQRHADGESAEPFVHGKVANSRDITSRRKRIFSSKSPVQATTSPSGPRPEIA